MMIHNDAVTDDNGIDVETPAEPVCKESDKE